MRRTRRGRWRRRSRDSTTATRNSSSKWRLSPRRTNKYVILHNTLVSSFPSIHGDRKSMYAYSHLTYCHHMINVQASHSKLIKNHLYVHLPDYIRLIDLHLFVSNTLHLVLIPISLLFSLTSGSCRESATGRAAEGGEIPHPGGRGDEEHADSEEAGGRVNAGGL